jgi:hypothetical protein
MWENFKLLVEEILVFPIAPKWDAAVPWRITFNHFLFQKTYTCFHFAGSRWRLHHKKYYCWQPHILLLFYTHTKYLPLNCPDSSTPNNNTPRVTSSSPFYNSQYDSAAAFRNGTTTFSEGNFKRHFVCINFTTALRRSGVEIQLFRGKFQASFRVHILYRQRCSVQEWNYNFSEGNFKRRFVCIKLFHSSTWAYNQNMKAHIRPIHFCALCKYFMSKNLCGVSIGRIEVTCGRIYMAGLWAC